MYLHSKNKHDFSVFTENSVIWKLKKVRKRELNFRRNSSFSFAYFWESWNSDVQDISKFYLGRYEQSKRWWVVESERKVEFSVVSDPWNTIWLVKKALYESEERQVPVRIEVKSGSVESTIFLVASLAQIGAFAFMMITYIRTRRQKETSLFIKTSTSPQFI